MVEPVSKSSHIVILGAGVIGLTTAISVLETLPTAKITIVAECMAEDQKSVKYTSSWAGAHHVTVLDGIQRDYEIETFKKLWKMVHDDPTVPLLIIPQTELYTAPHLAIEASERLSDFMPDFKITEPSLLPTGCESGVTFTTVAIDTPNYLKWLTQRIQSNGATFIKSRINSLDEILSDYFPTAIFNCTGLGSLELIRVEDRTLYPTRGQTVLIHAPWVTWGITKSGNGEYVYVIPRKSGDVILGGTREDHDWYGEPRPETAEKILKKALEICPELLPPSGGIKNLIVVEHGCGFRPSRKDGIRVELKTLIKLSM